MSTETVSPLRQRMIEDMNARKLGPHSQRSHVAQLQTVRCISEAFPRDGHARRYSPVSVAPVGDRPEHLQSQSHHDRAAVPVAGDIAAAGPRERGLSPARAAEDSAGDEPGRDAAPAGGGRQPQGPRAAQSRLRLRPARRRGGPAEGQAYRQRAEDHSRRAVQGPQGPQRHAVAGDARSAAAMVEGAPNASRCAKRRCRNAGCFPAARPASR